MARVAAAERHCGERLRHSADVEDQQRLPSARQREDREMQLQPKEDDRLTTRPKV